MPILESVPVVVILTAIPVEYKAVEAFLSNIEEDRAEDGTIYGKGIFHSENQEWNAVIREIGEGNPRAAGEVNRAFNRYKPDIMIFCGIAGSIKDAQIGDVVVADRIYYSESGKAEEEFKARPALHHPTYAAIERAKAEAKKTNWLNRLQKVFHKTAEMTSSSKVYIKPVASASQVIASSQAELIRRIKDHYNDAIAIEMEGFGFLQSCYQHQELQSLVVRGVSDLLDDKSVTDKGGCQEIAAASAAAFAFEVLSQLTVQRQREKDYLDEVRTPLENDAAAKNGILVNSTALEAKQAEESIIIQFNKQLQGKGLSRVSAEERVRLFVLAGSLLPENMEFHELHAHVVHKLYLNRHSEELTSNEQRLLYTTVVKDVYGCKAGWFWLHKLGIKRIIKLLEHHAVVGDDAMREAAIRMLEVQAPIKAEASFIRILKQCQHKQKRDILDYLSVHGTKKALPVVDELTRGQHVGVISQAILARIGILSRFDSSEAVKIMIDKAAKEPTICKETSLKRHISMLNTRELRLLSKHDYVFAVQELAKRGKASESLLKKASKSDDPELCYWGYARLIKTAYRCEPSEIQKDWPKSQKRHLWGFLDDRTVLNPGLLEETLLQAYLAKSTSELDGSVESKFRPAIAYLAWGLKMGSAAAKIVRDDLENKFARHVHDLRWQIDNVEGNTAEVLQKIDRFESQARVLTESLTVSALRVLTLYGKAADKIIAKKHFKNENTDIQVAAAELLIKYAVRKDIDILYELAVSDETKVRTAATQKILRLTSEDNWIARLLELNNLEVIKEVLTFCMVNKQKLQWNQVSKLFHSDNADIRLLIVAFVANTWTRRELKRALEYYLQSETYYYNVVCWLDRMLFSPIGLIQGYKCKLLERLKTV